MRLIKQRPDSPYTREEFAFGRAVIIILAITAVIFAAGLALVDKASASERPFDEATERVYQEALAFWGEEMPCSSVTKTLVTPDEIGGNAGQATLRFGTVPCYIEINDTLTPCQQVDVMRHEVGHLLGKGHSTDPRSVMYVGGRYTYCALQEAEVAASVGWAYYWRERRRCNRYPRRKDCWPKARQALRNARSWQAETRLTELRAADEYKGV